jgi:Hypervirulence associated proteins TUDOR domain
MSALKIGDRVSWNTSQGRTRGRVVEHRVRDFEFDGQHFTASDASPAFIVESEKTAARAAHKGSALRKLKG